MIRWLIYLVLYLLVWLIKWPLSPVAVIFFSTPSRLYLRWPFKWLETIDNDLTGDTGWKAEHLAGHDPRSTWNRIRWMWRNGGNALNYGLLGCVYWAVYGSPKSYGFTFDTRPMWARADGFWLYHRLIPLTKTKQLELMFGWNIFGPQKDKNGNDRCKFVCTIRIRTIATT